MAIIKGSSGKSSGKMLDYLMNGRDKQKSGNDRSERYLLYNDQGLTNIAQIEDHWSSVRYYHSSPSDTTSSRSYQHFAISPSNGSHLSDNDFLEIGHEFIDRYAKGWNHSLFVHRDTQTPHLHILINATNPITGRKYRCDRAMYSQMKKDFSSFISETYGGNSPVLGYTTNRGINSVYPKAIVNNVVSKLSDHIQSAAQVSGNISEFHNELAKNCIKHTYRKAGNPPQPTSGYEFQPNGVSSKKFFISESRIKKDLHLGNLFPAPIEKASLKLQEPSGRGNSGHPGKLTRGDIYTIEQKFKSALESLRLSGVPFTRTSWSEVLEPHGISIAKERKDKSFTYTHESKRFRESKLSSAYHRINIESSFATNSGPVSTTKTDFIKDNSDGDSRNATSSRFDENDSRRTNFDLAKLSESLRSRADQYRENLETSFAKQVGSVATGLSDCYRQTEYNFNSIDQSSSRVRSSCEALREIANVSERSLQSESDRLQEFDGISQKYRVSIATTSAEIYKNDRRLRDSIQKFARSYSPKTADQMMNSSSRSLRSLKLLRMIGGIFRSLEAATSQEGDGRKKHSKGSLSDILNDRTRDL